MPRQLGGILLERGFISQQQLMDGLQHQIVTGVRLGSALVQIEAISLDEVGRCLSVQHGVPLADPAQLNAIPNNVLSLVPKELCAQHVLIPFAEQGETVCLAMQDPQRAQAGEVSFHLKRPVKRFVVPELRIRYLLEHYHGLARDPRFLRERAPAPPPAADAPADQPAAAQPTYERQRTYVEPTVQAAADPFSVNEDDLQVVSLDQYTSEASSAATSAATSEVSDDAVDSPASGEHAAAGGDELDFDVDLDMDEPVAAASRLDLVVARLSDAASSEEVVRLLVEPAVDGVTTALLFWIRQHHAVGCCASGVDTTAERLQRLVVALDQPSLLQWSYQMANVLKASANRDPLQAKIATYFGKPTPADVMVAPVLLGERVVNLLCLWSPPGQPLDDTAVEQAKSLAQAASSAYTRVVNRLRGAS